MVGQNNAGNKKPGEAGGCMTIDYDNYLFQSSLDINLLIINFY